MANIRRLRPRFITKFFKKVVLVMLKGYQFMLSPLMGSHCRFYPSCSNYAVMAIKRHGVMKGCGLTLIRLLHCHPWHCGGYDPVPHRIEHIFCAYKGKK